MEHTIKENSTKTECMVREYSTTVRIVQLTKANGQTTSSKEKEYYTTRINNHLTNNMTSRTCSKFKNIGSDTKVLIT